MEFTTNWFEVTAKGLWDNLIPQIAPKKALEIGTWEGASACYLMAHGVKEMVCIDTWEGGAEHVGVNMVQVEGRCRSNLAEAERLYDAKAIIRKERSTIELSHAISLGQKSSFDLVYIDGSHRAADVLTDACMAFELVKTGGYMIFDDYFWALDGNPLNAPKVAIDAFVNIFGPRLRVCVVGAQLVAQKMG